MQVKVELAGFFIQSFEQLPDRFFLLHAIGIAICVPEKAKKKF